MRGWPLDFAFDLSEIVFRSGVQIASSDILTFQNKIKKDKATQTCSQRMQSKGIDQPSYHPDLLAIHLSWQRTLELASRTPTHPQNNSVQCQPTSHVLYNAQCPLHPPCTIFPHLPVGTRPACMTHASALPS